MTKCETMRALLSAFIDSELSVDESTAVRLHLEACAACQQELDSMKGLNHYLKSSLSIDEIDRRIASIEQAARDSRKLALPEHARSRNWITWLVASAALLLLAVLVSGRADKSNQPTLDQTASIVAHLVRATGPIQVLLPGADDWTTVEADSSVPFVAGLRLKTNREVLCEFQTTDRGKVRVNEHADLILHTPNQFELLSGQLWCLAPAAASIDVDVPIRKHAAPSIATFACPQSSELQCKAGSSFASCASQSSNSLDANVTLGEFRCPVAPGESVSVDSNQNVDRSFQMDSLSKIWQLPLLAVGKVIDQELLSILNEWLAPIGRTKAAHFNEIQIEQLGPPAAIPLLAYAVAESSPTHLETRRTAIRLAVSIADQRSIPLLESLSSDSDSFISNLANSTLLKIADSSR